MKKNLLKKALKRAKVFFALGVIISTNVLNVANFGTVVAEAAEQEDYRVPSNITDKIPENFLLDLTKSESSKSSRSLVGQYFVANWQLTNTQGSLGVFEGHNIVAQSILQAGLTVPDGVQGNLWVCLEPGKVNVDNTPASIYSTPGEIGLSTQLDEQLGYLYHFGYGLESVGKTYDNKVSLSNYAYSQSALWGYITHVAKGNLNFTTIPEDKDMSKMSAAQIAAMLKQWKPSSLNADIAGTVSQDTWAEQTAAALVAERDKKAQKADLTRNPIDELKKGEKVSSDESTILKQMASTFVNIDQEGVKAEVVNGKVVVSLADNADLKTLNGKTATIKVSGRLNVPTMRSGVPPVSPGGEIGIGTGATASQYAGATQKLAIWNDPTPFLGQVTFKVKIRGVGDLEIEKKDKESGVFVPGTKYKVTFSDKSADQEVTINEKGTALIKDILHDTTATMTEIYVPAPYTLDPEPFTAKIIAGEVVSATQNNLRQKAQVTVQKSGVESLQDLWNSHYSLKDHVFDIREGSEIGKIVDTITTNEKGYGETTKDQEKAKVEVDTEYWLTERTAGAGFVNTFKPVKFKAEYAGQTVSIVLVETEGTNQEVTGKSVLTKEDKDTGEETQGNATFEGAEYTLFYGENIDDHKKGDPVLWSDSFKPELLAGTKSENPFVENSVTIILDKDRQVGVDHLGVGKFFWKETKAPIGYSIDTTEYSFEIAKIDDLPENSVIEKDVAAKEQVIRFGFDFLKFANSLAGSAAAGLNDIEFKLTPVEPTKPITGAEDTTITKTDPFLGFDGYGSFSDIPYGDYILDEVNPPAGYQRIKPLHITSALIENEEDYAESYYLFTIKEEGQKDPLKTVKVPYKELTNKAFTVNLNKLLLYDLPEEPGEITSLATYEDGNKSAPAAAERTIIDKLSYNLKTKDDWYVVTKSVDVEATLKAREKDEKAELVVLAESAETLKNEEKEGTWEIEHKIDTTKVEGKSIVRLNYVYENEAAYKNNEDPVAIDDQLENEAQTVLISEDGKVAVATQAHTGDEKTQTFLPGSAIEAHDIIYLSNSVVDGRKQTVIVNLHAVLPEGMKEFKAEDGQVIKSGDVIFTMEIETEVTDKEIVLNAMKEVDTSKYPEGTQFPFSEKVKEGSKDEDGEIVAEHNPDFTEETQVLIPDHGVSVATQAHTGDKKTQTFLPGSTIEAHDIIYLSNNVVDGRKQTVVVNLHALLPKGTTEFTRKDGQVIKSGDVIFTMEIETEVTDKEIVLNAMAEVNTADYPEGTQFPFSEKVKDGGKDEDGEIVAEHNPDFSESTQILSPEATKPAGQVPFDISKPSTYLPSTGEFFSRNPQIAGAMIILITVMSYVFYNRKRKAALSVSLEEAVNEYYIADDE